MKIKFFITAFCLMALRTFAFEGTIKQTIKNYNGTGIDVTMSWSVKGNNCRIDMKTSDKDAKGNTVLLMDAATKTLKTYNDASGNEKFYFEVKTSDISAGVFDVSATRTTEVKVIKGFNCEKWTVRANGNIYTVWITKDVDMDWKVYQDFFKSGIEFQALALEGVKGFPILTESRNGSNDMTVDQLTPQAVSANVFTVPSEYKLYVNTTATKKTGK